MKNVQEYFRDYDSFHKTKGNKLCHAIGIPLIVMTTLGLLQHVVITHAVIGGIQAPVTAATVLWFMALVFYFVLHPLVGIAMMVSTFVLYFIGTLLSLPVLWALFILGWIVQFVGHAKYEKKSPAFLQNLTHLLIGPAYVQNYLIRIVRY